MTKKELERIIDKYLTGKASDEELKLLQEFENFALSKNKGNTFKSQLEKQALKSNLFNSIEKNIQKEKVYADIFKIAASFIIAFGIFYFVSKNNYGRIDTIVIANNNSLPKSVTLPDGSTVILNANSRVTYSTDFNINERKLKLSGEAYFKVVTNQSVPFIVETKNLITKDIGTEFNINGNNQAVMVTVSEGIVDVYNGKDTLNLVENQQAVFNTYTKQIKSFNVNSELYDYWTKEQMVFNDITFKELAEVLYNLYDTEMIFLDEATKNLRLSIAFRKSERIEDIIYRINQIKEINITKNKDNMIAIRIP
tara:strand:+ start:81736 stop:82665 length:930 start_codon:yes stop_codon:yes gene_type:complete